VSFLLRTGCELNCVSVCSEVTYCWRAVIWTVCLVAVRLCTADGLWAELCVWLQWGYVLLSCCDLNFVSGCSEVMYCWRAVNWTLCLFSVRLCTAGIFWTELCVCFRWVCVLLADCEINSVSVLRWDYILVAVSELNSTLTQLFLAEDKINLC